MGTIQEEYLIIQSVWEENEKLIDEYIKKIPREYRKLFIKCPCISNGEVTYFVNWDGSKEGWDVSEIAKEERKKFIDFINKENISCQIIRVIPRGEIVEEDTIYRISKSDDLEYLR